MDIIGEVNYQAAWDLKKIALERVRNGVNQLLMNFSKVTFVDSQTIGAIIFIWKEIVNQDGQLYLVSYPTLIGKIRAVNLDRVIRVFEDESQFEEYLKDNHWFDIQTRMTDQDEFRIIRIIAKPHRTSDFTELNTAVQKALREGARHYAIDLSGFDYVYSNLVSVLIQSIKRIHQKNGTLCIYGISDEMIFLFKIVGLHQLIRLFKTEQEFQEYLASQKSLNPSG